MPEDILLLKFSGPVAEVTFNKPSKLNAIDRELAEELVGAFSAIEQNREVKAVIVRGAGRAFMAGGDLKTFHDAGEQAPEAVKKLIVPFHRVIRSIRELRAPVIAAVHGAVAGGGLALALACDFVIASSDAVFTPAYLKIGTNPDGGTTWSVPRLLGERRALEWLLLGDPMSAEKAAGLGLINRVVAREDFEQSVQGFANRLATGPAQAQASLKRLIWSARGSSLEDQLDAEADGFTAMASTADFREGVAAFFERREPRFGK
ncbi:MAG TPA: enoyl-CoA hydratase-related protein [Rhizomicrobium sp.]|jgi:2-(1,2-epoxy-1,2-dihydrophenyl)acetyl-CoA isomerase